MSNHLTADTLDLIYVGLIAQCLTSGERFSPRREPTLELSGISFTLTNPRRRFITIPARKWSLSLAFGELAWHLAGSRDVAALNSYSSVWSKFAFEGEIRGSCYGYRIFAEQGETNSTQWSACRELLKHDPDSRRAVINLFDAESDRRFAADVSCTIAIQFLVRNQELELHVFMRSNDVYRGLPYDVFFYSVLQEMMAAELGVRIGSYHHHATSLHLYERDRHRAESLLSDRDWTVFDDVPLTCPEHATHFHREEEALRAGHRPIHRTNSLDAFWEEKLVFLQRYHGSTVSQSRSSLYDAIDFRGR